MPRPRIDPDQKRKEILDTAEILIEQHGPHKVTMQDISAAQGMSQSNIYRFFPNKDTLFASLADRWFEEVETALAKVMASEGSAEERFEKFVRTQFTMKRDRYDQNPALFVSYLELAAKNPEAIRAHVSKLASWLQKLIRACGKQGATAKRTVDLIEDLTIKFRDPHLISAHRKECTDARLKAVLDAAHLLINQA